MSHSFKAKRRVLSFTALALAAIAVAALLLSFPPPVQGQQPTLTVGFGSETISDKTYTAGARVNQVFDTTAGDQGLPKLPEATVTNFSVPDGKTAYYTVAYTAAGLPDGLTMSRDRVIRGTPTTATTEAATVSYFATVNVFTWNGSAFVLDFTQDTTETLAFNVTVNEAVTFDAEAQKFIDSKIIVWVSGSGWRDSESDGTIHLPGGHRRHGDPHVLPDRQRLRRSAGRRSQRDHFRHRHPEAWRNAVHGGAEDVGRHLRRRGRERRPRLRLLHGICRRMGRRRSLVSSLTVRGGKP